MFTRDLRLFLRSLRTILFLGAVLAAGCAGAVYGFARTEQAGSTQAEIVVCNQDDSRYGSLVLKYAANHELIQALVSIDFCDTEEAAVQAVEEGAAAAVIIPDGFFSGVYHGDTPVCRLVLSADGQSARRMVEAYLQMAADLLTRGQQFVFSGDYYMDDLGADADMADAFNQYMNLRFFTELTDAQEIYLEETTLAYTDSGLSSAAHYLAVYLAFLLSVLSLGYDALYQTDAQRGRLAMLASVGIRSGRFLRWKVLLPFGLSVLLGVGIFALAGQFLFLTVSAQTLLLLFAGLLCLSVWSALFACGLGRISGAVLFTAQVLGLLLCGGIIPYVKLKPFVLAVGAWTPLGTLYRLFTPLLGGRISGTVWVTVCAYTLVGVLLYRRRMRRLMLGREDV